MLKSKKNPAPPRLAAWMIKRFFPDDMDFYTHLGDLEEGFNQLAKKKNKFSARLWYWKNTLRSIPFALSRIISGSFIMFRNYLKVALRNVKRHKGYALINTTGLAIGMACCILIVLYIQFELSYDKYHEQADRICLLKRHGIFGGKALTSSSNNALTADLLKNDFFEVENAVRIGFMPDPAVKYGDNKFYENQVIYADGSFFDIFTYPLLKGDPISALSAPYSVVLTEAAARKYFNEEDPLGKSLRFNNKDNFTVTGVIQDVPRNSHLLFEMICSFQTLYSQYPKGHAFLNDFISNVYRTYILMQKGVDPAVFETKFPDFIEKYGGRRARLFGASIEYFLMPLTDIHLRTPLNDGKTGVGAILYIYIFALIAFVILIIACINFMNLATANSYKRAKEVGMRKVIGASKRELIQQFLSESFIYSFVSLALAFGLAQMALPVLSSIVGYKLSFDLSVFMRLLPGLVVTAVLVGLVAGSYPAFFLAAFQPVRILKGGIKTGSRNSLLRNFLVVLQFSISIILIIGTFIIIRQLDYMKNKNPGFNKDQVAVLSLHDEGLRQSVDTVKILLADYPGIIGVAVSSYVPGQYPQHNTKHPEGFSRDQAPLMYDLNVDADFIPTLGMKITAGRNFSQEFGADSKTTVIINETAAKEFGWENPIGKKIADYRGMKTVIGVVRDYHQLPVAQELKPLLIRYDPDDIYNPYQLLSIRIAPGNISRTLKYIETKWHELFPNYPFDYYFLDESFNEQFWEVERIGKLITYFAGLAVLIACLGLYGLISFIAEQRTKEIGIRKVLGATTTGIVTMLSRELLKMVLIANVIAWPTAYFCMRTWLATFPFREDINLLTFVLAGVIVLVIGLVTVSYKSIKAGLANPIDSLMYE